VDEPAEQLLHQKKADRMHLASFVAGVTGQTNMLEHQILLDEPRPTRGPQYRAPYALIEEMKSQVDDML
jgi:hypothetical protein